MSLHEVHECDCCPVVAAVEITDKGELLARYCADCHERMLARLSRVAHMISMGTPPDIAMRWADGAPDSER